MCDENPLLAVHAAECTRGAHAFAVHLALASESLCVHAYIFMVVIFKRTSDRRMHTRIQLHTRAREHTCSHAPPYKRMYLSCLSGEIDDSQYRLDCSSDEPLS